MPALPVDSVVTGPGRHSVDPQRVVENQSNFWKDKWRVGPDMAGEAQEALRAYREYRNEALLQRWPQGHLDQLLRVPNVMDVIKSFKAGTAKSMDGSDFVLMAALPPPAIELYAGILRQCLEDLVFPAQCMLHLIALLRKKLGVSAPSASCTPRCVS